jgi:peptide/nickel transport system ATP-binding protein
MSAEPLLAVRGLTVVFPDDGGGERPVVEDLGLELDDGDRVALVGESGSGKSVAALACLGLIPPPGRVTAGTVRVASTDMFSAGDDSLLGIRGAVVGLIFQEPAAALNPVYTIGFQIAETVRCHRRLPPAEARAEARRLLGELALDDVESVFCAYPHQISGGQAQRAMIALALAGRPRLLIADEPTTALDLITQAEILELITRLTADRGTGLLLISHDLSIVSGLAERVVVLYAGRVVEEAPSAELFSSPLHPYTRMLLAAAPGHGGRTGDPERFAPPAEKGCRFAPRCPLVTGDCRTTEPELAPAGDGRSCRCPVTIGGGDG